MIFGQDTETITLNGIAAYGAKIHYYNQGTPVLADVYADLQGTQKINNPVSADVNGQFNVYLVLSNLYDRKITFPGALDRWDRGLSVVAVVVGGYTPTDITGNYSVLSTDRYVVASPTTVDITATLPLLTTLSQGQPITFLIADGNTSGKNFNVVVQGPDTIDVLSGDSNTSIQLTMPGERITLIKDGTVYRRIQ